MALPCLRPGPLAARGLFVSDGSALRYFDLITPGLKRYRLRGVHATDHPFAT